MNNQVNNIANNQENNNVHTWTIVDICELSMTNNQLTFIDNYTKWKYVADIPYFEYIDPSIIPNIINESIIQSTIQIEKNKDNKEEINISVPYKIYGKTGYLVFKLNLVEKYIIDKIEVSENILTLHHKLNKLMAIFEDNEAFLLFPKIDHIDFMKFVKMYIIFSEKEPFRGKNGGQYSGHKEHAILHYKYKYYYNQINFYDDKEKAKNPNYDSGFEFCIYLKSHKASLFNAIISNISNSNHRWYGRIIKTYLSLRYMYNYIPDNLIDKNKRYIQLSTAENNVYDYDIAKYKYTINEEYIKKYSNEGSNEVIHEVNDFEKWW